MSDYFFDLRITSKYVLIIFLKSKILKCPSRISAGIQYNYNNYSNNNNNILERGRSEIGRPSDFWIVIIFSNNRGPHGIYYSYGR